MITTVEKRHPSNSGEVRIHHSVLAWSLISASILHNVDRRHYIECGHHQVLVAILVSPLDYSYDIVQGVQLADFMLVR